jgi:hypothetical protein
MSRILTFKILIFALLLSFFSISHSPVYAGEKPTIESFKFTPSEIDLLNGKTNIEFELIVSHPFGIENVTTFVKLSGTKNNILGTTLIRTNLDQSIQRVIFKGSLEISNNAVPDVYKIVADPILNNESAGYQFWTGFISTPKVRNLVGGESGLIIREGGNLDLDITTFAGPSYEANSSVNYINPALYSGNIPPIWKVGEIFDPKKYFELQVPSLMLEVSSSTPDTCKSENSTLRFNSQGLCTFKVFTKKTKEYLDKSFEQSVVISAPRLKPSLQVPKINSILAKDMPKTISISPVYSISDGYIQPFNLTSNICLASAFFIKIFSGGECRFTYQSTPNSNYLQSDLYEVKFEVSRDPQTVTFTLPSTVNISSKFINLAAKASSGENVTYSTSSTGICSITGSTLNLLGNGACTITATQVGTSTLAPASAAATVVLSGAKVSNRATITCVKGKSTKRVNGVNPKCPRGFKIKGN